MTARGHPVAAAAAPPRAASGLPRCRSAVVPVGGRPRRGALGDVAEDRRRAGRAAPADRPQLHRGEVLRLVEDHVAEARRALEQIGRLVDEHGVGRGPRRRCRARARGLRPGSSPAHRRRAGRRAAAASEAGSESSRSTTLDRVDRRPDRVDVRLHRRRCGRRRPARGRPVASPAGLHLDQHRVGEPLRQRGAGGAVADCRGGAARPSTSARSYAGTRQRREPRTTTSGSVGARSERPDGAPEHLRHPGVALERGDVGRVVAAAPAPARHERRRRSPASRRSRRARAAPVRCSRGRSGSGRRPARRRGASRSRCA